MPLTGRSGLPSIVDGYMMNPILQSARTCFLLAVTFLASTGASAAESFLGVWGTSKAACYEEDGVNRMVLSGAQLDWYETRCHVFKRRSRGQLRWTLLLACRGEGKRWSQETRLSFKEDKLLIDRAPVGSPRRSSRS